ncbi:MAG TPA: DUF4416 family protein [Pirellulales bacterium]|nr:DUF4416 family protein [Pirellulales bacterium]
MGRATTQPPVLLIMAVVSRYPEALDWAADRSSRAWSPIADRSQAFAFTETDYYRSTMGEGLLKQFLAFERPIDPARLPQIKLETGDWEQEYARLARHAEPRPLNLDPGYLTVAKLVLASTKDHSHRLYLGEGIYGEVTLYFRDGRWQHRDWTYPDYRRPDFQDFFLRLRDDWQRRIREARRA